MYFIECLLQSQALKVVSPSCNMYCILVQLEPAGPLSIHPHKKDIVVSRILAFGDHHFQQILKRPLCHHPPILKVKSSIATLNFVALLLTMQHPCCIYDSGLSSYHLQPLRQHSCCHLVHKMQHYNYRTCSISAASLLSSSAPLPLQT